MRPVFWFLAMCLCSCNNQPNTVAQQGDSTKVSFNDFISSIQCDSIGATPVVIDNSVLKRRADTIFQEFKYDDKRFTFVLVREQKRDDVCSNPFSFYFMLNNSIIHPKSVPAELRTNDHLNDQYCDAFLQLDKATTFQLNGISYLTIPTNISLCTGLFCKPRIDHTFAFGKDSVTYLVSDGWQLCDLNNDGNIDQILFDDDPKTDRASAQIWTYKNNSWSPLRDGNGEPYLITFGIDTTKHDTLRVLSHNWVKR